MTEDFGHYKLLGEIGRGGMGIVYQAFDPVNNRLVAIKQLIFANIDPAKSQEFRDRFRREAATAARLAHPNIVTVYDVSTESDNYFYVMEYLEGHSLRRELAINGGKLSVNHYYAIFKQVVAGLSFAHTMNVVHRDVKPDNIFILKDGTVKITDFGIARATDFEQTHLTKTGVMLGTLAYVSPEQLQDAKSVDHRADIFSLGVVSYESMAGHVPFSGEGIAATIVKIVSEEEKPLHLVNPQVSVPISAAVSRSMRKRVKERFRTVLEFAKAFEANLAENVVDPQKTNASVVAVPKQASNLTVKEQIEEAELHPTSVGADHSEILQRRFQTASVGNLQKVTPIHMISTFGKEEAALKDPCVLCQRSGRLVVADSATRRIHSFTLDGRWLGEFTFTNNQNCKTMGGAITRPSGIAFDSKGLYYVTDSSDQYVRVFDRQGIFLREFKNIHGKEGGLQGIAIDSTGLVYVSEGVGGYLQVYQAETGVWIRRIGSGNKAEGPAQMQLPSGLVIDRLNQIYCTDYGNSKVFVFSKSGLLLRSFGGKGSANGLFNVPRAVALDRHDKIYVLDSLNHRVQVFGPTGSWLYSFGGRGSEPGKFVGPADLTIAPESNLLLVADKGNHRVQIFEV
jgi:serine/threonine protein kinase